MKLAIEIDQRQVDFAVPVERIQLADRLGYDFVFSSENTGSDVMTPLGFTLAITKRIGVATSLAVTSARTPTAAAMAFQTLRHMAGPDRQVLAGIGNSSAERVEAWHGQPWGRPSARLRDYVAIMRKAFDAGATVAHSGREISVPYAGPGSRQFTEPLTSLLRPFGDIPILLGTGAPSTIALTAEVADGWLPLGFAPGMMSVYGPMLEEGFHRAQPRKRLEDFQIWAHTDVIVTEDIPAAMRPLKEFTARMACGALPSSPLGNDQAPTDPAPRNRARPYANQLIWSGYGDAYAKVAERWDARAYSEAIDSVPDDYIDNRFLIGPMDRIVERSKRWLDSGATGLIVRAVQDEVYAPILKALKS